MKKLMMMLMLVAAVVSAKAAVVNWNVTATLDQRDYIVYLLASAPGDYANVDALAAAAVGTASIVKSGRDYMTGAQKSDGDKVTKTADYYFAIVSGPNADSFNYVAATGLAALVYDPDAQESKPGSYVALTAADILAGQSKAFGGDTPTPPGPGTDEGPEPTSGLLLLVGGSLLALRRKQK